MLWWACAALLCLFFRLLADCTSSRVALLFELSRADKRSMYRGSNELRCLVPLLAHKHYIELFILFYREILYCDNYRYRFIALIWHFKWRFIDYIVTPVSGEKGLLKCNCLWIIQEIFFKNADPSSKETSTSSESLNPSFINCM